MRDSDLPAPNFSGSDLIDYVNWLNDVQGYFPAYDDVRIPRTWQRGPIPGIPVRNPRARFFIPNADEWHKAAYYDPVAEVYYDYATGSNTKPTAVAQGTAPGTAVLPFVQDYAPVDLAGGPSPFGTVGQTGNVHELEENLRWYRWGVGTSGQPEAHRARVSTHELSGAVGFSACLDSARSRALGEHLGRRQRLCRICARSFTSIITRIALLIDFQSIFRSSVPLLRVLLSSAF